MIAGRWVHYMMGDYPTPGLQVDNDTLITFYTWLAKSPVFSDHNFVLGTNSTRGRMMLVGSQTPTLKNPPFGAAGPEWDLPSSSCTLSAPESTMPRLGLVVTVVGRSLVIRAAP